MEDIYIQACKFTRHLEKTKLDFSTLIVLIANTYAPHRTELFEKKG
jgi:hypothetical protein